MENYQLKRTNVLLGGQMKYDLIINNGTVDNFYITPISPNVPFNRYIKDTLLNYSHLENIKKFYNKTSSSFYRDFVDPTLTSLMPLPDLDSNTQTVAQTDTTYDAGIKKVQDSIYNKSFEILCPLWLEHIENASDLYFEIQILSKTGILLHTTKVSLKDNIDIEKYFTKYFEEIGLDKGCNWVMDINSTQCVVSGINVLTGLCDEKTLTNLYSDLTYRERPLIEFNNMLTNELKNHNLISKQLFNFNLCFNLSDIVDGFVYNEIKNQTLDLKFVVHCDGQELGVRDIFTNHEFIERKSTTSPTLTAVDGRLKEIVVNTNVNVLNHLQDNNYVEGVTKNKIVQNICHWCLSNNSQEHFNLYDGFSLITQDQIEIPYYNGETANLIVTEPISCYPFWCNNYIAGNQFTTVIFPHILDSNQYDYLFSNFSGDCWVKNVNYKIEKGKELKILLIQSNIDDDDYKDLGGFCTAYEWTITKIDDKDNNVITIAYSKDKKKIIIITPILDNINIKPYLYKNFVQSINSARSKEEIETSTKTVLDNLYNILSNPDLSAQKIITFNNGLTIVRADSPSLNSTEIDYYKGSSNVSIIRNFGRIKPFFIKDNDNYKNYKYRKKALSEMPHFYRYFRTKYKPKYPSIGYFAFKKINED